MLGKRGGIGRFTFIWLVVFVILIIISLFVASFFINNFAVRTSEQTSETLSQMQDQFRQQKYDHLTKHLINQQNLNDDYQDAAVLVTDNQLLYDQSIADGVGSIYTNCNINSFVCEIKERNYQLQLENQFNLKNIKQLIKTKDKNDNQVLILIPIISDNQLVNIPIYSILPTDLKIYQEINNGYNQLFTEYLNKKSPALPSKIEVIKLFLNGYYYQQTKDFVISSVEVSLRLGELNSALQYSEEEYQLLDDSTTEKITKYQQVINKYYPKAQQVIQKEKNKQLETGGSMYAFIYEYRDSLFDKSSKRFIRKTLISKEFLKLGEELKNLRDSFRDKNINEPYQKINIQESETSKLLRLKILQARIGSTLLTSCEEEEDRQTCLINTLSCQSGDDINECVLDFLEEINSVDLCETRIRAVDSSYVQDQCYLRFSECPRIRDNYLREQCENEARVNE
jgi:hypothetical protein